MEDVDKLISEAEEEIEKLKTLKAKREELNHLRMEINADSGDKVKVKKEKRRFSLPRMTSRLRKAIATVVVLSVIATAFFFIPGTVTAVIPSINYADPDNNGMFADQSNGDGVNWTVNITDDVDIDHVVLQANDSGSWVTFYDSGSGLGALYHNTSGQNGNWTGSWTTYYWKFCLKDDTGWHNTTIYSFTTKYQWGYPEMAVFDEVIAYDTGIAYKNATNDYYFWYENGQIDVKNSTTGTNWSLEPKSADVATGSHLYNAFTYEDNPSVLYYNGQLYRAYYDGTSWNTESTGIKQTDDNVKGFGGDAIYYDGVWNLVAVYAHNAVGRWSRLKHYDGTFPSSWSEIAELDNRTGTHETAYYHSIAVLNGTLHLIYRDPGADLHWQTYNGVAWTDRGDIELNIGAGCSMVKDPVNQQLVCVYVNGTGDLVYRTTDNLTAWSDSHTILSKGAYTIQNPQVEFMDSRIILSFSYNLRGNYNIYTISSPGYAARISGLNYTYNRIQWPDAAPNDVRVNSTVFSMKNINNRNITTIMWHFEDLGEITAASNFKVWTNMSGAWNDIGTCDASGNVTTLDISGEMAGGAEWIPGNMTYWKMEILAIGDVSEDLHTVDEEIYYKITLA